MENKLRSFQYKVIHNILPTNNNLYKMNVKTSPRYDRCNHSHKNLLHLLYECPRTQTFWQMLISWWNEKRSKHVALNALDHFVIIAKYQLFELFSLLLNEKILCERTIAFKNNTKNTWSDDLKPYALAFSNNKDNKDMFNIEF